MCHYAGNWGNSDALCDRSWCRGRAPRDARNQLFQFSTDRPVVRPSLPPLTPKMPVATQTLVANVSSGLDEWRALSSRPSPIPPTAALAKQPAVAPGLHIFYYAWYATPVVDGKWVHWNHEVLADWDAKRKNIAYNPPVGSKHKPEEGDIGSNFYPAIGPYSSKNATVRLLPCTTPSSLHSSSCPSPPP
jgi:hypothetical protein